VSADVSATVATGADRGRVVETVVAAFAADPAFRFFFPDPRRFTEQATLFAGYLFDKRVGLGTVWIVDGGESVAMWQPPAAGAHGGMESPGFPDDVLARLEAADSEVDKLLPGTPFWYLGVLATHPRAAGRRLGRAVRAPGLAAAAEAGLPAYLETTTAVNVGIYERSGWRVTGRATAVVAGDSLPLWVLTHG
jgi:hypothetical protein